MDEKDLDDLFRAARAAAPVPSAALVARVLADAAAAQPTPVRPAAPPRPGWFARLAVAFGGRGVFAGLAGAAVAGMAVGFFGPVLITAWPQGMLAGGTVELFPDADAFLGALEEQG